MAASKRIFAGLLCLVGIAAAGIAGTRIYMGRAAEDRIEEREVVDFAHLSQKIRPGSFLMCPPNYCNRTPDAESPVFAMDWEALRDRWTEVLAGQPRVKLVGGDGERRKITYIRHSALLKLPDVVTIEFIPMDDDRASFAIEEHPRYRIAGLAAARRRVLEWVSLLGRP